MAESRALGSPTGPARTASSVGWVLFALALVSRLVFNLGVHKLGDHLTTDMASYASVARLMLSGAFRPRPELVFWPFGTSALTAGVNGVFGHGSWQTMAVLYAAFGAGSVWLAWDTARRVSRYRWVPLAVGLFGVVYFPIVFQGSVLMSEPPFTFFLMLHLWFGVRWVQEGRPWDALGFGVAAVLGLTFRPQLLLSVVLAAGVVGASWIRFAGWRRSLVWAAIPLLLGLSCTSGVVRFHTGHTGLVATNGPFNLVFGRCHNLSISWQNDETGGEGVFAPSGMRALWAAEQNRRAAGGRPLLVLDPVREAMIQLDRLPGEDGATMPIVVDCLRRTSVQRQLKFSATHVAMLWHVTPMFPPASSPAMRTAIQGWRVIDILLFEVPSLLAMIGFLFLRRRPELQLLAVNYLALLITAALFFGEMRMRLPYMYVIVTMSFEGYAIAWTWLRARLWGS